MTPAPCLRTRLRALALCLAAAASLPGMLRAEAAPVEAGLLSGWQTGASTRMAGLHLRLAPGWKTYWRAPGEAGIPPEFDWSGSETVAGVRVIWPRPEVFMLNGMRAIGYRGDVVLPVEVTPRDPARPVTLRGAIALGVCRDICVPAELRVESALSAPGEGAAAIRAALANHPAGAAEAGLAAISCRVEPVADGLRVEARLRLPATGGPETVVIEPGQPGIWASEAESARHGGELVAVAEMVAPSGQPFALDRGAMVVTVLGRDRAVEVRGCPAP